MANNHKNFAQTTLAAAITDTTGTSITVASETSFPDAPFIIAIDTECMLVTNVSSTTWTVTRGYESSTAATHLNGAAVYHDVSAGEVDSFVVTTDTRLSDARPASDVYAWAKAATQPAPIAHTHAESDVTNLVTDLAAKTPLTQPVNTQTGTTYTLVLGDAGYLVTLDNASAITLTVPLNSSVAFPIGTHIDLLQLGAGKVTVSSSATISSKSGNKSIAAQYVGATLVKTATDTWMLLGDLVA